MGVKNRGRCCACRFSRVSKEHLLQGQTYSLRSKDLNDRILGPKYYNLNCMWGPKNLVIWVLGPLGTVNGQNLHDVHINKNTTVSKVLACEVMRPLSGALMPQVHIYLLGGIGRNFCMHIFIYVYIRYDTTCWEMTLNPTMRALWLVWRGLRQVSPVTPIQEEGYPLSSCSIP